MFSLLFAAVELRCRLLLFDFLAAFSPFSSFRHASRFRHAADADAIFDFVAASAIDRLMPAPLR